MLSPLVAVSSRAALYPIQSIIIIALLVSGAYFHLLDIARNSSGSSFPVADVYSSSGALAPAESKIWARKSNDGWKWTVDPLVDAEQIVQTPFWIALSDVRTIFILPGDKLESQRLPPLLARPLLRLFHKIFLTNFGVKHSLLPNLPASQ